jgi:8-amino-7-oxononanoate synthase
MNRLPQKLQNKINERIQNRSLRSLGQAHNDIDFSSNDYLGFSVSVTIYKRSSDILNEFNVASNGATGSRLLSGNHVLYTITEQYLAEFHHCEAALLFNSGYDANVGFFSSVPQRGDLIYYDELCHASIRDGIRLSNANAFKFKHNDLHDLIQKLEQYKPNSSNAARKGEVYIVTESVFSMDGDIPDLVTLAKFCDESGYHFIVDEAHAVGVLGHGRGLIQELQLEPNMVTRIVTFGKGLGCHGAAILGSKAVIDYLVNFARSFIYSTALPPHSVATIKAAYMQLSESTSEISILNRNIASFRKRIEKYNLKHNFIVSNSAIQSCIIPGNEQVRLMSEKLKQNGFDVKPILSPTVTKGQERLRFCIHSFNTEAEIEKVLDLVADYLK